MNPSIRPSTPADAPAIGALFTERHARHNFDLQLVNWKYWQPRTDWSKPRSFVVTNSNGLVAHAAIAPGTCAWTGRRLPTLHVFDWVARAGTGAGVTLLKHISHMTEALLAIGGGPETLRILPHLGFRSAGAATGYARPLFPLRMLRGDATWRLLPRLARAVWRRSSVAAPDPLWRARRLAMEEVSQIISVFPRPGHGGAVTERTVGLFQYLLSCPSVPMQLYAMERGSSVRGYFLLASVAGQARIADCWMESDESSDWSALILCAVEHARRDPHAAEVVTLASDPLLDKALRSCGFYARFQWPIQVRPHDPEAMPPGTPRVQMLDNDAAYLSDGRNSYWG